MLSPSPLREFYKEEVQKEYKPISETALENRDAKIKLEATITEHIAASAQLNAACADLTIAF